MQINIVPHKTNYISIKLKNSYYYFNKIVRVYKKNTWLRPTLPGGCPPSTISAQELNFCVRNGNRCILFAIITTYLYLSINFLLVLSKLLNI